MTSGTPKPGGRRCEAVVGQEGFPVLVRQGSRCTLLVRRLITDRDAGWSFERAGLEIDGDGSPGLLQGQVGTEHANLEFTLVYKNECS